ncbi:MAG TPA: sulfotransferase [Gammaproteobacteria bacterium]|nr:sulfotransferase [Gammaproteobacteria bacterium]
MTEPRIPNLFLIGAPKCGTTALSHYLAGHPDIFMSEQAGSKEPNYFAPDLPFGKLCVESFAEYLALYRRAPQNARYLGDASVRYLRSKVAVPQILEKSPNAKLIVMIRNPIEIAQALHNQRVKRNEDAAVDFEKAWRLQDQRLSSDRDSISTFVSSCAFEYREFARIGTQLARLYNTARRSQVLVIDYGDFARDTARVYQRVLAFLGLEPDGRTSFPILNARVRYRVPSVQRGLVWLRIIRERLGIPGGWGVQRIADSLNARSDTGSAAGSPLRPAFRAELEQCFKAEVELVSRLQGRDYSHWLRG